MYTFCNINDSFPVSYAILINICFVLCINKRNLLIICILMFYVCFGVFSETLAKCAYLIEKNGFRAILKP